MIATATRLSVREAGSQDLDQWDAWVRGFPNHRVVHTRAWVEFLRASGQGKPLYLIFELDGEVVCCLPGLLVSVMGRRLFGSPLAGWQTVSMGPAFDTERVSTAELMAALIPFLEQRHGVSYIEMLHSGLDAESMKAAGFTGRPVATYRAPLCPVDEHRTFKALKDSAQRNIRRAERLGLIARFEEDEGFVAEHYEQLRAVFVRGGHVIPFGPKRLLQCFRHMQAAGNLLATAVYLPGGRVSIATGMFLIEGNELLLWSWAHNPHYRWYRPTELMTWMAMRRAMAAGCETFDFMGLGDFKVKFGATPDLTKVRWMRARPAWLAVARDVAEMGFRCQQTVRGRAARLVRSVAERGMHNGAPHPPAVVLGDVDLVRALGLGGIASVVVAPPGDAARFSRFTRATLEWIEPWDRPDELVDRLVSHGETQSEPPVLFYEEDRTLLLVSRYRERLRTAFRFVIANQDLVEQLVDKARFQELAARLDLPVPPAKAFEPARDHPPGAGDIAFPAVVKPLTRRDDRWTPIAGARKAVRVDGPDALRALWPELAVAGLRVLVQQLVPGPENRLESYHTYVDESGGVVAEFTGRKIRTHPAAMGDSCAIEITQAADVAALGRDVVRRLHLRGVAKLDFKRAPDDRLHLLEVNPRFTLWHHLGARAGVNIPALVHDDLVRQPRPKVAAAQAGVRWCKAWADWRAARSTGVPLWKWLPWALGCDAKRAVAWDDPLPLLRAGMQTCVARVRARWRSRRAHQRRASAPHSPTELPRLP